MSRNDHRQQPDAARKDPRPAGQRRVKKAPNGMGSVYPVGNRWIAAVSIPGEKRVYQSCRTEDEANAALRILLGLREQGKLRHHPKQPLVQWLETWITRTKAPEVRPHTLEVYRSRMRHVAHSPALAGKRLDEVTPGLIEEFRRELIARHLQPASINSVLTTLTSALQDAMRQELIGRNPAQLVRHVTNPKHPRDILPAEYIRPLYAHTQGTWTHALWHLLIECGLRIGEALALRWRDIDTTDIHIHHTVTRHAGTVTLGPVKTPKSRRDVPLTQSVAAALEAHKTVLKRRQLEAAAWTPSDRLFPRRDGELMSHQVVGDALKRDLAAVGAPALTAHAMRRTFATDQARALTPLTVTAELMGHASIRETADIYTQVQEAEKREAMERLSRWLREAE